MDNSDLKIPGLVKLFENKVESMLKSSEILSIDSAVWYLETTVNYKYGDASKATSDLKYDRTIIKLSMDNGSISVSEVWSQYALTVDRLRSCFQSIISNDKQLIVVQVEVDSVFQDTLQLQVTSVFGTGYINNHYCDFDPNGPGWEPLGGSGGHGGTCGDHLYPFRDATTEIQQKIMTCKATNVINSYYAEPISKTYHAPDFPVENFIGNPNYMGYYMYNSEGGLWPGFGHCLSVEECNFYLNGTKSVIYNTLPENGGPPEEYSFVSLELYGDFIVGKNQNEFHTANVLYGIVRVKPDPTESLL